MPFLRFGNRIDPGEGEPIRRAWHLADPRGEWPVGRAQMTPCRPPWPVATLPVPFGLVINQPPVQYKGAELDPERGPGLGCFRFQLAVLAFFVVLTPLTVVWEWPAWISAALLFAIIVLLLVTGQTIIFLLRLVAADRRSRRRPLGSATKTVGEIDDEAAAGDQAGSPATDTSDPPATDTSEPPADEGPVRQ